KGFRAINTSQQLTPMRESGASGQQRSRLSTALMRSLLLNPRTHQSYPSTCVEARHMRGRRIQAQPKL
ncbi:hypothetical protein PIB30_112678, partial [Stylosanthes scabra]|nr:hypothetical protein [Stylosanthes scabra]